jgi:hypothetical protein
MSFHALAVLTATAFVLTAAQDFELRKSFIQSSNPLFRGEGYRLRKVTVV